MKLILAQEKYMKPQYLHHFILILHRLTSTVFGKRRKYLILSHFQNFLGKIISQQICGCELQCPYYNDDKKAITKCRLKTTKADTITNLYIQHRNSKNVFPLYMVSSYPDCTCQIWQVEAPHSDVRAGLSFTWFLTYQGASTMLKPLKAAVQVK